MARKTKKDGGRGRKGYSAEFKAQAVRVVVESGESIASVAKDLGISHSALSKWLRQAEARGGDIQGVTASEREELERLRKENRKLRQERDILKKSVAFFVSDNS